MEAFNPTENMIL